MKPLIAQILIGASILTAAALGYRILRLIQLLAMAAPEETASFGWSLTSFIRWLLIAISPLALYGVGFALHRESLFSRLGKAGLCINITYILIVAIGCFYVHRLISAFNRNA